MTDTELIDYLETREGAALVSDDRGHWAVTTAGIQSVPENPPDDVHTTFFITKAEWRPTIRKAILAYRSECESLDDDADGVEELKTAPAAGVPRAYVTIIRGIGGWNSVVMSWAGDDPGGFPGYEPLTTGFTNTVGRGTREEAVAEAKSWAADEGIPVYIPGDKGDA